jgi:uncharacterized membrane protein YdjX (TVP38/TMEM64 family)
MDNDGLRVNADRLRWLQLGLALALAGLSCLAYWLIGPFQAEIDRAVTVLSSGDLERLRAYIQSYGNWAPVASLLLMVLQALAAPVPSFAITFANGLAFGVFWGWLLSVAGHALAASVCFWLARSLGRQPVEMLSGKIGLSSVDGWIERRGATTVLMTRLVPGISFDAVSYAVGLTGMRYGRFIAATVAGTMPQTLLYAYLGQEAPQYAWILLLASGLTIAFTVTFSLLRWWRGRAADIQPTAPGGASDRRGPVRKLRPAVADQIGGD